MGGKAIHVSKCHSTPDVVAMGLAGIAPATVSAIAFGIQYVPVKKYKCGESR